MFYKVKIRDRIRLPPESFGGEVRESLLGEVSRRYDGFISKDLGIVIGITNVDNVQEGVIIPGDGAAFYKADVDVLAFKPELHETLIGQIRDIADFGAFLTIGPIDGMIHVSQTMSDFVSMAKDKALQGKETGRVLKVGDKCKAKVIAVSYKDVTNPKIGLTMRQQGLGKFEWIVEDYTKAKKTGAKSVKKK